VQALGCHVAWIGPVEGPTASAWLPIADVGEQLAPIVEAVPGQLLAGHLAALAGVDGDNFRSDDDAFREARERYGL
jgi:glucosamine 6-phosphate synthetase-like amidotransferase/phosphosugar isomerase protein